jgi:hypothetical protein
VPGLVTTIQHFDAPSLRDFLYNHEKENNGFLQRFVDSKGTSNTLFRAIWSPCVFHVERRTNRLDLADRKFSMHQRVVTFEGDEHMCESKAVTDTLLGCQLQRICEHMADHCTYLLRQQGEHSRVSRMVLHFKLDDHGRVWLLWCSSIRTSSEEILPPLAHAGAAPVDLHTTLTVPDSVKRFLGPGALVESGSRAAAAQKRAGFVCGPCLFVHGERCAGVCDASRTCEITYKMVMDHWERTKADVPEEPEAVLWNPLLSASLGAADEDAPREHEAGAPGSSAAPSLGGATSAIPPVFRKLHPQLTEANFEVLRKDPLFLYSRMTICDQCFLLFTAAHAPRLPPVPRMPSSLLIERSSLSALSGELPAHSSSSLGADPAQRSLSAEPRLGALPGRDSVMSRNHTSLAMRTDGASASPTSPPGKGGTRSPGAASGEDGGGGGAAVRQRRARHPSMAFQDPVAVAGYTFKGLTQLSRAPRRSSRLAENFVSSVASQQFNSKVEKRRQPMQDLPAPPPLDFVAAKGAAGVLPERDSLRGMPETALTLAVLQGEEPFLRAMHGATRRDDPEERRVVRAAAKGAARAVSAGAGGASGEDADGAEQSQQSLREPSELSAPEASGGPSRELSGALKQPSGLSQQGQGQGRARARSWINNSPLLPGGGSVVAPKRERRVQPGFAMYAVPGTLAQVAVRGGGVAPAGEGAAAAAAAGRKSEEEGPGPMSAEDGAAAAAATAAAEAAGETRPAEGAAETAVSHSGGGVAQATAAAAPVEAAGAAPAGVSETEESLGAVTEAASAPVPAGTAEAVSALVPAEAALAETSESAPAAAPVAEEGHGLAAAAQGPDPSAAEATAAPETSGSAEQPPAPTAAEAGPSISLEAEGAAANPPAEDGSAAVQGEGGGAEGPPASEARDDVGAPAPPPEAGGEADAVPEASAASQPAEAAEAEARGDAVDAPAGAEGAIGEAAAVAEEAAALAVEDAGDGGGERVPVDNVA